MNKSKIEWCDYTWNPVTGCRHNCEYCYAKKIAENPFYNRAFSYGFEPHFYPERLNDPMKMKKPQTIFVCSMADLFGEWVPDLWIYQILEECRKAPQHTYIFLTKNPKRYTKLDIGYFTTNMWFGTTITGEKNVGCILEIQKLIAENTFVSFEPLLEDIGKINIGGIKQVIIGAQTNPFIPPPGDAVRNVVAHAIGEGAKVFFKDSMDGVQWLGHMNRINTKELCWGLHK